MTITIINYILNSLVCIIIIIDLVPILVNLSQWLFNYLINTKLSIKNKIISIIPVLFTYIFILFMHYLKLI